MAVYEERKELAPFLLLALLLAVFLLILPFWFKPAGPDVSLGLPAKPDVIPARLEQLPERNDVRQKKLDFFSLMKPMVLRENRYIAAQRDWVQSLDLQQLSENEREALRQLMLDYDLLDNVALATDEQKLQQQVDQLLIKVAPIPEALVLVQAANESAWGRSRFAREGNNLFGQWCFSRGCGLVPRERPEGQYHEVAVFESPQLSIRAYLNNLNSFWAYEDFREARAARPDLKGADLALYLADHLTRYSQRGEAYTEELRQMVQVNRALIEQAATENLR